MTFVNIHRSNDEAGCPHQEPLRAQFEMLKKIAESLIISKRHLKTVWSRYDISDKEISSVHVFLRGHLR
jgi:hypothetical protein